MAMNLSDIQPRELRSFLSAAGEKFINPLIVLGVAESLTDEVAIQLVTLVGLSEKEAEGFVEALHFCDFVVERNSEWHFSSTIFKYLNDELGKLKELARKGHSLLFDISVNGDINLAGDTIPRYLLSDIGRAYHKSPLSPEQGLEFYANAASKSFSGSQWLIGRLAVDQQERGILPTEAIEPSFLRGMTLYREGQRRESEYFLQKVVDSTEIREEVAISCHIVGRLTARKPGKFNEAEELLRRSLSIGEEINHIHHQAQALHTLGQLIGKNRNRADEAEELLRRSLKLLEDLNDKNGQAQTQHTLGQLIGKSRNRADEAEELLRRSLKIGEKLRNKNHQAQVLFSLGKLVWEKDAEEGKNFLLRSITINKSIGNQWAVRMVERELNKRITE